MSAISLRVIGDVEGLVTVGSVSDSGEIVGVADVENGVNTRCRSRPTAASTTMFRKLDIVKSVSVWCEGRRKFQWRKIEIGIVV